MVFVFDLDDTLSETDEFSRQWIAHFFAEREIPLRQVADCSRYSDGYFDWKSEDAIAWYKQYGDEMMENFPLKEGVFELLNLLHERGHRIVIATARDKNWHNHPEEITCRWLAKNGIHADEIFVGLADKQLICQNVKADVFVDDDVPLVEQIAKAFAGTGRVAFLATTKFNRNLPTPEGAIRIEKLSDILKFVNV